MGFGELRRGRDPALPDDAPDQERRPARAGRGARDDQSFSSVSQIVGPGIAGFLIQHGWLGAYGVAAALAAVVGVVLSFQPEPGVEPPLADSA